MSQVTPAHGSPTQPSGRQPNSQCCSCAVYSHAPLAALQAPCGVNTRRVLASTHSADGGVVQVLVRPTQVPSEQRSATVQFWPSSHTPALFTSKRHAPPSHMPLAK